MRWNGRVSLESVFDRMNPTMDDALANITGPPLGERIARACRPERCPPPDREWIPQLYREHRSLSAVIRLSGLSEAKVRQYLVAAGVEFKRGRPRKTA